MENENVCRILAVSSVIERWLYSAEQMENAFLQLKLTL